MSDGMEYRMPRIGQGQTVVFSRDTNFTNPTAAIVLKVGVHSIDVLLATENGLKPMVDVRHVTDPWVEKHAEIVRNSPHKGLWDYTEEVKVVKEWGRREETLRQRIVQLEADVERLKIQVRASLGQPQVTMYEPEIPLPAPKPEPPLSSLRRTREKVRT